jgi:hypothetical protein
MPEQKVVIPATRCIPSFQMGTNGVFSRFLNSWSHKDLSRFVRLLRPIGIPIAQLRQRGSAEYDKRTKRRV